MKREIRRIPRASSDTILSSKGYSMISSLHLLLLPSLLQLLLLLFLQIDYFCTERFSCTCNVEVKLSSTIFGNRNVNYFTCMHLIFKNYECLFEKIVNW